LKEKDFKCHKVTKTLSSTKEITFETAPAIFLIFIVELLKGSTWRATETDKYKFNF